MKTLIGLRVDVDTYRGTRLGVPGLCRVLAQHSIEATFFFSVGPDNMGRHLWRLLRPAFFLKMLRSKAAGLYGWDILLRGTFGPGPMIGRRLGTVIRDCAGAGHEVGLHAWDHHAWQSRIERADRESVRRMLDPGMKLLSDDLGLRPVAAASPAWRCTDEVLLVKDELYPTLAYNSDCRGEGVFLPRVRGRLLRQPQVPVNLPTYDEVVGREGVTHDTYNDFLLSKLRPGDYNVLTIHAEVEGIIAAGIFDEFLGSAIAKGFEFGPLSALLPADLGTLPTARMEAVEISGREGWISTRAGSIPES